MSVTFFNARSAKGPQVAEWMRARYPEVEWDQSAARRLTEWERGAVASVEAVDRMCYRVGTHPCELPDSVWSDTTDRSRTKGRPKKTEPLPPKDCEKCGKRIKERTPAGKRKSPAEWLRVRFCSAACQRGTSYTAPDHDRKPCEMCGGDIPQHFPSGKRRSPADWKRARYCGKKCAGRGSRPGFVLPGSLTAQK